VKWSETKIFVGMYALSWNYNYEICLWVTVQYVLLSHCLIDIWFMYFALYYVLINCSMFFNYSLYVCFLVLCVLFSIFCSVFCIVLCIVSPHAYSCLLSFCVQYTD
jgi:hypothetical protein